ncbi:MAG: phage portal protein [Pseudomonadota bacterium]
MNFFSRLFSNTTNETKSDFLPDHIALGFNGGQAVWQDQSYHTLCREGYRKNPVIYSCVRMTADGAARIPLKILVSGKGNVTHPAMMLLNQPNTTQSGFAFRTKLFGYLQLSGNSYVECSTAGNTHNMHLLRPDRVKIMTNQMGYPAYYQYRPHMEGKPQNIDLSRIAHLKYFAPDDDYYGQSPMVAAMRANEIHNRAADFQKSLLDNSARPSGCLVYQGVPGAPNLTKDQFARLKSELENHYTGAGGAGRPMVLEGGLEWRTMSLSPADMEFSNIRHNTARDIALAFGVPPMMLGIPGDNTYSNYQEAVRVFTRNTLIPLSEMFCEVMSRKFSEKFQDDIQIKPDIDELPAFLPEREANRQFIANANFLSDTQKYDMLFS